MARRTFRSMIVTALVLGVVVGVTVGSIGAMLDWPPAVSGGITGAIVVGSLQVIRQRNA